MSTNTKTIAKDSHQIIEQGADKAQHLLAKTSDKAEQLIAAGKDLAVDAEQRVEDGLDQLRENVPGSLSRAAHQAEDMARAGIEKARAAGRSLASQASEMRKQTASYVREEPTKALLMAAAAGAVATLLIGWAARSNSSSSRARN